MDKKILLSLCMFISASAQMVAMDDAAGAAACQMVVVDVSCETADQETQTDGTSLMVPFELIGDGLLHDDGRRSIGTQMGQSVAMVRGLDEEALEDGMRRVLTEDQQEKMRAAKKRMKYMVPIQCAVCGLMVYLTYFLPR